MLNRSQGTVRLEELDKLIKFIVAVDQFTKFGSSFLPSKEAAIEEKGAITLPVVLYRHESYIMHMSSFSWSLFMTSGREGMKICA
jgi:hypothetical protein